MCNEDVFRAYRQMFPPVLNMTGGAGMQQAPASGGYQREVVKDWVKRLVVYSPFLNLARNFVREAGGGIPFLALLHVTVADATFLPFISTFSVSRTRFPALS